MGHEGFMASVAVVATDDDRREPNRRPVQQVVVEVSLGEGFQNLTVENLFERAGATPALKSRTHSTAKGL